MDITITDEMIEYYERRTAMHIELVDKYCQFMLDSYSEVSYLSDLDSLTELAPVHDMSKFHPPERDPYILITWQYKCRDDGVHFALPDEVRELMNKATRHHIRVNPHHPDYFDPRDNLPLLNRKDRDKPPEQMVDATRMPVIYMAEMVADWCAMSEERGNTPMEWAKKNVNIRWKFTDAQVKLIDKLIEAAWEDPDVT
jgi:hypothetical protein